MGFFDIFKHKPEVDLEAQWRENLARNGRITDGIIVENEADEAGNEIVYYFYTIHGVDFESSEMLTEEQRRDLLKYAPGAKVSVRFDPKNHGNSILM